MSGVAPILTIAQAARQIAAGALSPRALVEQCLARIEAHDGEVNAFHDVFAAEALAEGRTAEGEIRAGRIKGPLHGIPIGIKAVIDIAGRKTTANSRLLPDYVPDRDATVVRLLREAGAIVLGHTDTFEFAFGGPTFDALYPPARNPWGLERSTGGSSSGSAAAVAAGFCLGAIGSDAGGSVRSPASHCGIAGLKPTLGRVSAQGDIPLTFSFDTVGPMAWTAEDCALMLQAIAGYDPADAMSSEEPVDDYLGGIESGLAGLRVGLIRHFYAEDFDAHPEIVAAIDAAAGTLRGLGARVDEIRVSDAMDYHATGRMILPAEALAIHEEMIAERLDEYGEVLRGRVALGGMIRAVDYIQAQRRRTELTREMDRALGACDLLLTAGLLVPQAALEAKQVFPYFTFPMIDVPFNLTGHPAISVCAGYFEDGMPIGAQIVGRYFDEAAVLRAAHAYEGATPWRDSRPDLG